MRVGKKTAVVAYIFPLIQHTQQHNTHRGISEYKKNRKGRKEEEEEEKNVEKIYKKKVSLLLCFLLAAAAAADAEDMTQFNGRDRTHIGDQKGPFRWVALYNCSIKNSHFSCSPRPDQKKRRTRQQQGRKKKTFSLSSSSDMM